MAGFLLKVKGYPFPLTSAFNGFLEDRLRAKKHVWQLDFKRARRRLPTKQHRKDFCRSSYAGNEICVDSAKRKIVHFQSGRGPLLASNYGNGKFISYCYAQILAVNQGLLLHAACAIDKKGAYIFIAKSGGGKSTVAGLSFPRFRVLGDDIIAVKNIKNSFCAFATPWRQKPFIKSDRTICVPVKAVIFLKKSKKISFTSLASHEALVRIIYEHAHFLSFMDAKMAGMVFKTAASLARQVPSFEMAFTRSGNFWPRLQKAISVYGKN